MRPCFGECGVGDCIQVPNTDLTRTARPLVGSFSGDVASTGLARMQSNPVSSCLVKRMDQTVRCLIAQIASTLLPSGKPGSVSMAVRFVAATWIETGASLDCRWFIVAHAAHTCPWAATDEAVTTSSFASFAT